MQRQMYKPAFPYWKQRDCALLVLGRESTPASPSFWTYLWGFSHSAPTVPAGLPTHSWHLQALCWFGCTWANTPFKREHRSPIPTNLLFVLGETWPLFLTCRGHLFKAVNDMKKTKQHTIVSGPLCRFEICDFFHDSL